MHPSGISRRVAITVLLVSIAWLSLSRWCPSQAWGSASAFCRRSPSSHSTSTGDAPWSRRLLLRESVSPCLLSHQVSGRPERACPCELALLALGHAEGQAKCLLRSGTFSGSILLYPHFRSSNILILIQVYINRKWCVCVCSVTLSCPTPCNPIGRYMAYIQRGSLNHPFLNRSGDCLYYSISLLGQKSHILCRFKLCS